MKKNSGFTLVEVVVSFGLTMIIILFLFQIIITLKQIYTNNFVKADLVLRQANISQMINKDLMINSLGSVTGMTTSGNNCYDISFEYGTTRRLCYNKSNNTIIYNDYEFELVDGSSIGNVAINYNNSNSLLTIDIPISYPDMNDDFGIKIAYFK